MIQTSNEVYIQNINININIQNIFFKTLCKKKRKVIDIYYFVINIFRLY